MDRQTSHRLFVIAVCLIVLLSIYLFTGMIMAGPKETEILQAKTLSDPKDYAKIDSNGKYKPYHGYTVISMCKDQAKMKQIQEYLESSAVLQKYITVLPSTSYHVTNFNIFSHIDRPPVDFVQAWLNQNPERTIPNNSWIPPKDIFEVMNKAQGYCDEIGQETSVNVLSGKMSHMFGRTLKVIVDLDKQPWLKLLRQKCAGVFKHDNSKLSIFHMALGYLYRDVPEKEHGVISREVEKMLNFVQSLGKLELRKPKVMFFDSMERFVPFTDLI